METRKLLIIGLIAIFLSMLAINGQVVYNFFNYTNTSGGGVSFNGSPVNLNGSNLFNGTISNYSTLDFMNISLNLKVNKSGDTMTGNLINNYSNISSESIQSFHLIGQYSNESLKPFVDSPESISTIGSKYLAQLRTQNSSSLFIFQTLSNLSGNLNQFSAIKTNGTQNNYNALGANNWIFYIGARGSTSNIEDGTGIGTKAGILMRTSQAWNTTSTGTAIDIYTTNDGGTTRTLRATIDASGNFTVYLLGGVGNAYVCVDSAGKLYRGSPTC